MRPGSGGSKGAPPNGPKFAQFHAVFRKFWQNHMLAPPGGLAPPPTGNPLSVPARRPPIPPPTSDIWWPSLETFSKLFIRPHCTAPPRRSDTCWPLKELWSAQAGSTFPTGKLACFFLANFIIKYQISS